MVIIHNTAENVDYAKDIDTNNTTILSWDARGLFILLEGTILKSALNPCDCCFPTLFYIRIT
jgi:hypothetical protein